MLSIELQFIIVRISQLLTILDNEQIEVEAKYRVAFAWVSTYIRPQLTLVGLDLDYYDPDTSYEEDLSALARGLRKLSAQAQAQLDSL